MKNYKRTLFGSIITFAIGTSCCWISSLAVWLGGIAIVGTVANFLESTQSIFILMCILLAIISMFLYFRNSKKKSSR